MSDIKETETIDKLYLELSQFTRAITKNEIELIAEKEKLKEAIRVFLQASDSDDTMYEFVAKNGLIKALEGKDGK